MSNPAAHWLTLGEVADVTRFSVKTIRRAADRGDLTTVRLGRAVRVIPDDLTSFITKHRTQPATGTGDSDA